MYSILAFFLSSFISFQFLKKIQKSLRIFLSIGFVLLFIGANKMASLSLLNSSGGDLTEWRVWSVLGSISFGSMLGTIFSSKSSFFKSIGLGIVATATSFFNGFPIVLFYFPGFILLSLLGFFKSGPDNINFTLMLVLFTFPLFLLIEFFRFRNKKRNRGWFIEALVSVLFLVLIGNIIFVFSFPLVNPWLKDMCLPIRFFTQVSSCS